jgi:hypothetical protein
MLAVNIGIRCGYLQRIPNGEKSPIIKNWEKFLWLSTSKHWVRRLLHLSRLQALQVLTCVTHHQNWVT